MDSHVIKIIITAIIISNTAVCALAVDNFKLFKIFKIIQRTPSRIPVIMLKNAANTAQILMKIPKIFISGLE